MEKRFLRLLRILYQGFRLIVGGLKKEIDSLEAELNESTRTAETTTDKS